jgi:biotin carboxyl carrier protein
MAVTTPERVSARSASGTDPERSEEDRARTLADHAAIDRLADQLLPALIARLSGSGLGEIEVREGRWKARLRKPGSAAPATVLARTEEHRAHALPARTAAHRDEPDEPAAAAAEEDLGVVVARSPAVGVYSPRRDLVVGMPVRSGDRIGVVDMLGVNQDVLSPIDGVIGSSLAEAGEAVEYGQELVRIEIPGRAGQERPTPGQKAAHTAPAGQP